MNDFINEQMDELNLNFTPLTRQLLEQYVTYEYEGTVELTEENLKAELIYLHESSLIGLLITSEWVYSNGG